MKAGASKFDMAQALVEEKKPTGTEAFDELNKSFLWPSEILAGMGIKEGEEEEDEDEEEEEEEEEKDKDKDGDQGEAAFGRCIVCLKDNMHFSYNCPYWKKVPSGATVGPGYGILCRYCYISIDNSHEPCCYFGEHSGYAVVTWCNYCNEDGVHWSEDCPHRPKDKPLYLPAYKRIR